MREDQVLAGESLTGDSLLSDRSVQFCPAILCNLGSAMTPCGGLGETAGCHSPSRHRRAASKRITVDIPATGLQTRRTEVHARPMSDRTNPEDRVKLGANLLRLTGQRRAIEDIEGPRRATSPLPARIASSNQPCWPQPTRMTAACGLVVPKSELSACRATRGISPFSGPERS
jgi:hypothetical protein